MNTSFLLLFVDSPIPSIFSISLVWYLFLSVVTVVVFAHDKRAARRQRRRVPEKRLHLLELIGGFPGAWIAIILFHHKSRKPSFLLTSVLCTVSNLAVAFILIHLLSTSAASDGS